MVRKMTPSQYNAWVRQENARRKRAVDAYNAEVRRVNRHNERVASDHNRKVNAQRQAISEYNRRAKAHNQRLRREVSRLNSTRTVRYTTYHESVTTLRRSFGALEADAESVNWSGPDDLVELGESETANSVATLNALQSDPTPRMLDATELSTLRGSGIADELRQFDEDLGARWQGALFSLHPDNPDAARHFCTSARELLGTFLELAAPDEDVITADPNYARTPQGSVSRRARIRHCLSRRGNGDSTLQDFVEDDIDNVLALFTEFNRATHGRAGTFDLTHITAIKMRVEGAIDFVMRMAAH